MEPSERINVLVVDDDEEIRLMFEDLLHPEQGSQILQEGSRLFAGGAYKAGPAVPVPCNVVPAANGRQGVRCVKESVRRNEFFYIAFIDMLMPGLNGIETLRQIQAVDPRIHMVMFTAYSEYTSDDIVRESGTQDFLFLRKPVDPETITQLVRSRMPARSAAPEPGTRITESAVSRPVGAEPGEDHKPATIEMEAPSAEVCPFCASGIGIRVRRKAWMRLASFLARYRCISCGKHFLVIKKR